MGVDYLVCDECGEIFCDCGEYYYCENCDRQFCMNCRDEAGLEWDDEDGCVCSCKYCRNEAVDDDDILNYAIEKLNTTRDALEKEIIEKRKKETK